MKNFQNIVSYVNKNKDRKVYSDSQIIRGIINYFSENIDSDFKKIIDHIRVSRFFVCPPFEKDPAIMALQGPAFICYLFISSSNQHETPRLKRDEGSKEGILASVLHSQL